MRKLSLLGWLAVLAVGLVLLLWGYPRAFPFLSDDWQVTRAEAEEIARARFLALEGDLDGALLVVRLIDDEFLERRLQLASEEGREDLLRSRLRQRVVQWEVVAYPRGAQPDGWSHRARVTTDGDVTSLRVNTAGRVAGPVSRSLTAEEARAEADQVLVEQGYQLALFAEPEVRSRDQRGRTDHIVRYQSLEAALGADVPYGIEVSFAGEKFAAFTPWMEDPDRERIERSLQGSGFSQILFILVTFPVAVTIAIVFLRLYHAGEVGVRRGLQLFGVVFCSGTLLMILTALGATEGLDLGIFSRRQVAWIWGAQMVVIYFFAVGLVSFLAWTVGESQLRRRRPDKLAAFDALFHARWSTATVARSSLRGFAGGVFLAGSLPALALLLQGTGAWGAVSFLLGPWWPDSSMPGLTLLLFSTIFALYTTLLGRLLIAGWLADKLGPWIGGLVAALVGALIFFPPIPMVPVVWSVPVSFWSSLVLVGLFLRYDLLTSFVASLSSGILMNAYPLLGATDPGLQVQGSLALLGAALPLVLSLRSLMGGEEFVYHYDDVPRHVRRIAERERQRVELETARRIQSSILPELPPQLAGMELAHAYRPATEVGGDFYDVLALEDGRLAVAVGDVAGHGVSSGLVMSMARSALSVQVTFDPMVRSVFETLNRVVYQSARKRLLTTLCYALVDPERRQLEYASAGHLFPYRIGESGRVDALESVAYPLGVRDSLEVRVKKCQLEAGDTLFLFSDGVVEATPHGSDEPWGFDRLEQSLALHAGKAPRSFLKAVLADLEAHAGSGPRADDLTILVLRVA